LPREEWALAQGKKVLSDGVAAQTIEAQPVFGQIKPSRGEVCRALNNNLREDVADLGSAIQEVKTFRRRERNNVRQTAVSSAENELAGTAGVQEKSKGERGGGSMCNAGTVAPSTTTAQLWISYGNGAELRRTQLRLDGPLC
jgi:hypothetical protein